MCAFVIIKICDRFDACSTYGFIADSWNTISISPQVCLQCIFFPVCSADLCNFPQTFHCWLYHHFNLEKHVLHGWGFGWELQERCLKVEVHLTVLWVHLNEQTQLSQRNRAAGIVSQFWPNTSGVCSLPVPVINAFVLSRLYKCRQCWNHINTWFLGQIKITILNSVNALPVSLW